MKKLIIIIAIFISTATNTNAQGYISVNNTVNNFISPVYTGYINFVCNELGIKDITLNVYELKAGTGVFSNYNVLGYIEKRVVDSHIIYVIYVNAKLTSKRYISTVLGHEITHIKQDLDGYDILTNPTSRIQNNEIVYTSNTAKILEKEAVKSSELLYKSYKSLIKLHK